MSDMNNVEKSLKEGLNNVGTSIAEGLDIAVTKMNDDLKKRGVETFDADSVTSKLETINETFSSVSSTLESINDCITTEIQVTGDHALYTDTGVGKALLAIWKENSATFSDFRANFDEWTKMVGLITANNLEFEAEAINMYKDSGLTLDGVQEARDVLFLESAALVSENNSRNGETIEYYDEHGNTVTVRRNEDGTDYQKVVTDKNGDSTYMYYDAYGNYSVKEKNKEGKYVVKYYDVNGNELEEAPYTFGASGVSYSQSYIASMAAGAATGFISEYGFNIPDDAYANLIPEARALVDHAVAQINDIGLPDGSVAWQEKFNELDPTTQKAFIDYIHGNVSPNVAGGYSITSDIPEGKAYDGRSIVIPGVNADDLTGVGARDVRFDNGAVIANSANAVKTNIDGEAAGLKSLTERLTSNETFTALPEETKKQLNEYLNLQITQRTGLSDQINNFTASEINNVRNSIRGNSTGPVAVDLPNLGSPGDDYTRDYSNAAAVARSWNETLQGLDSMQAVTATFNSYGVFF